MKVTKHKFVKTPVGASISTGQLGNISFEIDGKFWVHGVKVMRDADNAGSLLFRFPEFTDVRNARYSVFTINEEEDKNTILMDLDKLVKREIKLS